MISGESANDRPAGRSTDKGTLFCVSCPYRGRFDGEWTVVETDDTAHYLCPNCGTEVLTRCRVASEAESVPVERTTFVGGGCR